MKKYTSPVSIAICATMCTSSFSAALPEEWDVDLAAQPPKVFALQRPRGESYELAARLNIHGKPFAPAITNACIYWQTNGMENLYWSAPATVSNNVLRASWLPSMDPGATTVRGFIGDPGHIYATAFQFRFTSSPGAVPNELPLPTPVIDFSRVTVLNPPWPSGAARPLPKYLHMLDFYESYPDDAAAYYRSRGNGKVEGGCSAVRDGGFLCRNFDFPLDERAEFVVRMTAGSGRYASVGVAQVGTNLTEQTVTSGKPSRWYKSLPGATTDGINENGVVCEINVVDGEPQWRSGILSASDIHPLAAVRWVLDNATSAGMAASNLVARIMFPPGWEQNFHWMISDETSTYIVENGECSNVTGRAVMTNFPLIDRTDGMGLERYNLLVGGESITNAWFTRAYSRSTNWESEFKDSTEMEAAKSAWETYGREELRGKGLWQTVHCSIYDIANRTLRISVQEVDDWYTFAVPTVGGVKAEAVKGIVNSEVGGTNAVKAAVAALGAKRDVDDLSYVTRVPGGWTPTEVDGIRYDIYYNGYSGWDVYKLAYYPEWGEWFYNESEWVEGPEDAETLTAHKLWSDETITFTRLEVEVSDSLALVSQIGSQAEVAARNYIQNNDIAKTKTLLRTGKPGEFGTGWGTLHYQLSSDRRWWSIIVPSITASWTTGGYVDRDGNYVSAEYFNAGNWRVWADPINNLDHTPVARFISSSGTNGSARCSAARWAVGITAGPGASSAAIRFDNSADLEAMPFLMTADVDHATGLVNVVFEDRSSVFPIEVSDTSRYENHYYLSNFRFADDATVTDRSVSVKCLYDVAVNSGSGLYSVRLTAWCTLNLGCPTESYVTTNPDYGRVTTDATKDLYYDPGLKATWRIAVTNGCFFSEIVSSNNLTKGVN